MLQAIENTLSSNIFQTEENNTNVDKIPYNLNYYKDMPLILSGF